MFVSLTDLGRPDWFDIMVCSLKSCARSKLALGREEESEASS